MLGRLKLRALRDRLDGLLDDAARQDLNLREALALLCDAEMRHREERRIHMGMNIAKFPFVRTLEGFDFEAQPSLDPKQIRDLASCRWVANGDALLILGPPGVGKSHLAVALGREAIRQGYSVLFIPAIGLITALAARRDNLGGSPDNQDEVAPGPAGGRASPDRKLAPAWRPR